MQDHKNIFDRVLSAPFLWGFAVLLTALVYAVGISIGIMEIDAAVYAHIAMEMAENSNWLEITYKGEDWLDKPHFQFWITAVSFRIFGYNNFAYKIPAILFLIVGIFYTYRYGTRYYGYKAGAIAALMLMTAQHIIMSNHDVRAEPYLTGLTIFSLYYWAVYLDNKKWLDFLLGCAGLACLMMTKGLFTILPVAGGVFFSLLYQQKWAEILHWQWLLAALIVLLFMAPTLIGYYLQFDMHPEKEIFGTTGISGIRFFFWDSQWGRFANTGPIQGSGDPTFFLHSLLWVFAPWSIIGYFALFMYTKSLWHKKPSPEHYTYFGFVFLFIIFSASRFQLPHYLNPLLPLLSILTAQVLLKISRQKNTLSILNGIQVLFLFMGTVIIGFLQTVYFDRPPHADTFVVIAIALAMILILYTSRDRLLKKIIFAPAIAILALNYYLSREFYSDLLRYQSETTILKTMSMHNIDPQSLIAYDNRAIATGFYSGMIIPEMAYDELNPDKLVGKHVFTSARGLQKIRESGMQFEIIGRFEDFRITTLNYGFVSRATRAEAVHHTYLLKIPDHDQIFRHASGTNH
jgi:4-amino-4-deoxy-L-arabinose transferase-like glycosyltransferase